MTDRLEAVERETQRDEVRTDPEVSPMVKRVMETFWRRLDEIEGRHPAVRADEGDPHAKRN